MEYHKSKAIYHLMGFVLGASIGALIGWLLGIPFVTSSKWIQFAAVGGAIGLIIPPVLQMFFSGREITLESAELPILGAKIKVSFSEAHRMVAWKIFVETATRIATRKLDPKDGSIREALTSLYKLFDIVRMELKIQRPSQPPKTGLYTIESYALRMLNDSLRPMLTRWHPRLESWEKMGRSEIDWPLAETCRHDLEVTRERTLQYIKGLGKILEVYDLDNILGQTEMQQPTPSLTTAQVLLEKEGEISSYIDDAHKAAGWRIFVEMASRVSTQPLEENTGNVKEALDSLYKLYDLIRTEIKQLPPAPTANKDNSVEGIALSILNGDLRGFLAKWHPRLQAWEKLQKPETEWSEITECRNALGNLRAALSDRAKSLGDVIKITAENLL